jgi:hypothetical protein
MLHEPSLWGSPQGSLGTSPWPPSLKLYPVSSGNLDFALTDYNIAILGQLEVAKHPPQGCAVDTQLYLVIGAAFRSLHTASSVASVM